MTDLSVVVVVPVLGRPARVGPLLESLFSSTVDERANGWKIVPVFVCSAGDTKQIYAVRRARQKHLILNPAGRSEYPRKINLAAASTTEDWLFTGADDLLFHTGWLTKALNAHAASGALVIGTNDLGNQLVKQGKHATHSLVHRSYMALGTIDEPGVLLHSGYDHNAVDVEFTETAMARGTWVFAHDSVVEHLHPLWHREVRRDPVYAKGIRNAQADRRLLLKRRHLWDPTAPAHFAPQLRRGKARWVQR